MQRQRQLGIRQAVLLATALATQTAFAQTIPDAGSLLRQQQLQQQPRLPLQIPAIQPADEEKKTTDDGIQVPIKGLKISGNPQIFSTDELLALINDAIGQSLGLGGLQNLVTRITLHYRGQGYFLSRAYLPPQDASAGIITIAVQEVGLDPAENAVAIVSDNLRLREDIARRIVLEAVPAGTAMRETDLERALLLLNRLPGLNAQVNLEPGSQPDTSRLLMALDEGKLANYSLGYDNAAGRYNGTDRLSVSLSLNDLTGSGDQLQILANSSNSDNTYAGFNYSRPLGYLGLQLNAGYNHLVYRLGKVLEALNFNGYSDNVNLDLSYPLKLTRLESLWLSGGFDHKSLVDRANGVTTSNKTVQTLNLRVDWQHFHDDGLTLGGFEGRAGNLDIDPASDAYAADQGVNGPRKNGDYQLFRYSLSRLQKVTPDLSLFAGLDGQLAANNLDSAEQLQYSGPYGVRAYPTGEGSGDEGAKLTLEGRYSLKQATVLGHLQASLFYDTAWLSRYHDPERINLGGQPNDYRIRGWGIGLSAVRSDKSQVNLVWATKIGNNPMANSTTGNDGDGTNDKSRLWLNASLYF